MYLRVHDLEFLPLRQLPLALLQLVYIFAEGAVRGQRAYFIAHLV